MRPNPRISQRIPESPSKMPVAKPEIPDSELNHAGTNPNAVPLADPKAGVAAQDPSTDAALTMQQPSKSEDGRLPSPASTPAPLAPESDPAGAYDPIQGEDPIRMALAQKAKAKPSSQPTEPPPFDVDPNSRIAW